jgi:hypothetical protein
MAGGTVEITVSLSVAEFVLGQLEALAYHVSNFKISAVLCRALVGVTREKPEYCPGKKQIGHHHQRIEKE